MSIKLFFYGGVGATTGANFLLEAENKKILVDCGVLQGARDARKHNASDFKYDPKEVSFLLVTHAHMDHIGRIPKLIKDGFEGKIVSTLETKEISEALLYDAYKIMISEEKNGVSDYLYEERHIREAIGMWEAKPYGESFELSSGVNVVLKDAGHILGSAIIEIETGGKKIAFTGDLGNSPSPLLRDTEDVVGADYIVMESVYGDRNHEPHEERRAKLVKIIKETIEKGGEVVIPAFSVDRTQVILYELNNMVEDGEIKSVPVFLDSPLALKVTEIYKKSTHLFNSRIQEEIKSGDNIFEFPKLKIIHSGRESRGIEEAVGPKIIIAGSGMSEGGRVLGHEARILGDPKNTLLLMGYQPIGTLGRKLQDGVGKVLIGEKHIKVQARIENVRGYSAHKDSDGLIEFIDKANENHKIKKVFVCMGEPKASLFLAQRLRDYVGVEAIYPELHKPYDL